MSASQNEGVPNKNISSFHYQHSHCIPVIEFLQPIHWDARATALGERGGTWSSPATRRLQEHQQLLPQRLLHTRHLPELPAATAAAARGQPCSSPHTPRVSPRAQNSTCSQSPERLAWRSYASEARIPTVWSFPRAHSWGLELLCLGARTEQARAQHESSSLGEVQQNFTANPNCWIHQQCQTPGRMIPVLAGQALQPEGRSSNVPLGASAGMSS